MVKGEWEMENRGDRSGKPLTSVRMDPAGCFDLLSVHHSLFTIHFLPFRNPSTMAATSVPLAALRAFRAIL